MVTSFSVFDPDTDEFDKQFSLNDDVTEFRFQGDTLLTTKELDFESNPEIMIYVTFTDKGGLTFTKVGVVARGLNEEYFYPSRKPLKNKIFDNACESSNPFI